jgi:hypothetical protein
MSDPITLLAVGTAVVAGVGAYGSYQAGKAQQYEYKRQAEQEKLSAQDREIERRNRLLQALGQRTVGAAAFGATLEGTPAALINRDAREYSLESLSSQASSASQIAGLKAAGSNAKRAGTIQAIGNLIQAGVSLGNIGMPINTPAAAPSAAYAPPSRGVGPYLSR